MIASSCLICLIPFASLPCPLRSSLAQVAEGACSRCCVNSVRPRNGTSQKVFVTRVAFWGSAPAKLLPDNPRDTPAHFLVSPSFISRSPCRALVDIALTLCRRVNPCQSVPAMPHPLQCLVDLAAFCAHTLQSTSATPIARGFTHCQPHRPCHNCTTLSRPLLKVPNTPRAAR